MLIRNAPLKTLPMPRTNLSSPPLVLPRPTRSPTRRIYYLGDQPALRATSATLYLDSVMTSLPGKWNIRAGRGRGSRRAGEGEENQKPQPRNLSAIRLPSTFLTEIT